MWDKLRRIKGAIFIFFLIVFALYIFSLNYKKHDLDPIQRVVLTLVSPVLSAWSYMVENLKGTLDHYVFLTSVQEENQFLKKQISELEQELVRYKEAYLENQRLRRLLEFKTRLSYDSVAAMVILHDLSGWFQTVLLNKGYKDGVTEDMPVVSYNAVVGRVLQVGPHYSRVMLITDPASAVDVIVQRSRVRGILVGRDLNTCKIKYVKNDMDVRPGDLVITSGKDGVFPRGLRVGVVKATYRDPIKLFQKIDVEPLLNLKDLEEVLVIKFKLRVKHSMKTDINGGFKK